MSRKNIKELYNSGLSISEIAGRIKISASGVKYILNKEGVIMRSRSEAVRMKHLKRLKSYSCSIPQKIPKNLLNIYHIGLALYWGEGTKVGNTVAIANSDPELILAFLIFLRNICHVDEKRLRLLIHYHSDQDENELIDFWSKITKIDKCQFYVGVVHKKSLREGSTKRLKFGTISLRYSDSCLLQDILNRVSQLKVNFN